ncbi:MAG: gliding motility lipoprotein GldH [Sphingobacteriaceae bacterium]|nr:gliding motility lipoprotein GldH [Sphingobacteriaceae bacterium]
MNSVFSYSLRVIAFLCVLTIAAGCSDNAVVDLNKEISSRRWSYIKKVSIPVKIDDSNKRYNLYMNLRHTADYKYSNIFVLIHQTGPGGKKTERKEFQLAYPDGEWLGSSSGNLYSYQLLFREGYSFPSPGTYVFEFEQNMRDNPLREVRDVGMRVEPVE